MRSMLAVGTQTFSLIVPRIASSDITAIDHQPLNIRLNELAGSGLAHLPTYARRSSPSQCLAVTNRPDQHTCKPGQPENLGQWQ